MKPDILGIYKVLYEKYGVQHWWPTTLPGQMHPSYHGKNFAHKDRFEIVVGAVLTQNTSWINVEKAIFNLNKLHALNSEKILQMNSADLSDAIRPSGYYNIKARRLKSVTQWWLKNIDTLAKTRKNAEALVFWRESLLEVYGVGEETADSILLYAFDFPTFVVDAYTKRIMSRHYNIQTGILYGAMRNMFMANLPEDVSLFKEFHALFVRLAKESCLKSACNPDCPLKT